MINKILKPIAIPYMNIGNLIKMYIKSQDEIYNIIKTEDMRNEYIKDRLDELNYIKERCANEMSKKTFLDGESALKPRYHLELILRSLNK